MSRPQPGKNYWKQVRTLHDKLVERATPLLPNDLTPYIPFPGSYIGGAVRWAVENRQHSLYVGRQAALPGYHRVGELVVPVPTLPQGAMDETAILIGYATTFFSAGITEVSVERTAGFHSEEEMAVLAADEGAMDELVQMRDSINPHEVLMANMLLAEEMTRPARG